ncbi:YBR280C [Saccharomyces arboricola H-6]|uniref:YBR280C n=1 Tax=Saccharomyces arboricola (strain H-6 / AS 2.3317 / CBS 10644) TaxID=1160507 RepID=J8PRG4_SACAR|nr:YBR280C [Saccharomyces arboricola H-6]
MSEIEGREMDSEVGLPPDIIQATLPFLTTDDIKNLSQTNKYYNTLLDFDHSKTLWHELFHKAFGTLRTNDEPFQCRNSTEFKTCTETILREAYPDLSWQDLFQLRAYDAKLYTWGRLKHGRLGYTISSNNDLEDTSLNGPGPRFKYGVNTPTEVPWFNSRTNSRSGNFSSSEDPLSAIKQDGDEIIAQVSSGGFSFQILTESGNLYSTGSTFSGGHKGPGPSGSQHDYNPFREMIHNMERSYPRISSRSNGSTMNTTGTFAGRRMSGSHPSTVNEPRQVQPTSTQSNTADRGQAPTPSPGSNHSGVPRTTMPSTGPHDNIYSEIEMLERSANKAVPGNNHIRRVFARNSFPLYSGSDDLLETFNDIQYVAVSSGRSHFLAMDTENNIYSWDSAESDQGVKIEFADFPSRVTNPILKIASGWNFNCCYIYKVGLVAWSEREAVEKGKSFANAKYKVIPNTNDINGDSRVIDFACLQDNCVFYINNEGNKLWKYHNGLNNAIDLDIVGKLCKINVCFASLVLFTDTHCYTLKITNGDVDKESLTELDIDEKVISVASGDYHTVALTESGHLYSWGVESQDCGCLGLGPSEKVVNELHIGNWEGQRNIRVARPTKIELPEDYICVSVTAGGWQTGALIIKKH